MPTYEYQCLKCSKSFEVSQRMSEAPLDVCPKDLCPNKKWGKGKVKRGIGGGAGLIFKGGGFYITDYRSQNYKDSAAKDSSPKESKPAAPAAPQSSSPSGAK